MKKHECRARRVVLRLMALCLLVAFSFPILRAAPSLGAAVNPFEAFLQRLAIQVKVGAPTVIDRRWSAQPKPMTFVISGNLPQGTVEMFAMLVLGNGKAYQSQKCSDNPFRPASEWIADFFEYHKGDRLVSYKTTNLVGNKLAFESFKGVPGTIDVKAIAFLVSPPGLVQNGNLSKSCLVVINYVK